MERQYLNNPKEYSYATQVADSKGKTYIEVVVADKYMFYFNRTGKSLLSIEDVSYGGWETYTTKAERDQWLKSSGSKKIYDNSVLPTLELFLKKYPAPAPKKIPAKPVKKGTVSVPKKKIAKRPKSS